VKDKDEHHPIDALNSGNDVKDKDEHHPIDALNSRNDVKDKDEHHPIDDLASGNDVEIKDEHHPGEALTSGHDVEDRANNIPPMTLLPGTLFKLRTSMNLSRTSVLEERSKIGMGMRTGRSKAVRQVLHWCERDSEDAGWWDYQSIGRAEQGSLGAWDHTISVANRQCSCCTFC
jgi:hypothetical protein